MRNELDTYYSPFWFATTLCNFVPISGKILEPCAGNGAISKVIAHHPKVTEIFTSDINSNYDTDYCLAADIPMSWDLLPQVDWVISNPPFNVSFDIAKLALEHAQIGVALALKITWLEATKERGDWLKANKPSWQIVLPRFKFSKGKNGVRWQTDSTTMCWFVWMKNPPHANTIIEFLTPNDIEHYYPNPDMERPIEIYQKIVRRNNHANQKVIA